MWVVGFKGLKNKKETEPSKLRKDFWDCCDAQEKNLTNS